MGQLTSHVRSLEHGVRGTTWKLGYSEERYPQSTEPYAQWWKLVAHIRAVLGTGTVNTRVAMC